MQWPCSQFHVAGASGGDSAGGGGDGAGGGGEGGGDELERECTSHSGITRSATHPANPVAPLPRLAVP